MGVDRTKLWLGEKEKKKKKEKKREVKRRGGNKVERNNWYLGMEKKKEVEYNQVSIRLSK